MHRKPRDISMISGPKAQPMASFALMALVGAAWLIQPVAAPARAQDKAPATQADKQKDDKAGRSDKDDKDTLDKAGRVATQPVRDVGIAKTSIDPVLQEALKSPYGPAGNGRCAAITAELTQLNGALGPDFGSDVKANEDKAERLALAGGEMLVNTLIPFRGLVREISGAAPAERRKASAISAGTARRGYLRGLAQTRKCKVPANPAGK